MASSSNKLTKYKSAVTIVTADVANAWYGGLYGSGEASGLAADDPRVIGHVHDGQHLDGHAGKVDLVSHVENQLRNANLADDAVIARNVRGFTSQSSAIPEFEVIDSTTYYYLDLSDIRSSLTSDAGEPFYVYYRPGGVAANNVYTDFASAYAQVDSLRGPRVVYLAIDTSLVVGSTIIPAGTYDMSSVVILIDGPNHAGYGTQPPIFIELDDGVIFNNLGGIIGQGTIVNLSTTSSPLRFNLAGAFQLFYSEDVTYANYTTSEASIFFVDTMLLDANLAGCTIGGSNTDIFRVSSGNTLRLVLTKGTTVAANCIESASGTSDIFVNVNAGSEFSREQVDWHTNPIPLSDFSVKGQDMVGTDGISSGEKGLVPVPTSSDSANFLRGDGTWATPVSSGEANLGGNVGGGAGEIFRDKSGVTLNFKTLVAGTGIGLSNNANSITITNSGAGGAFVLDTSATPDLVRLDVSGSGDYSTNDFVFGSSSLNDTGNASHDSRFLFDKSTSAFRAGEVTGTEWNTRGNYSFATGLNNTCSSTGATAIGGSSNIVSGSNSGGFTLSSLSCTITDVTRSGAIASDSATMTTSVQNAVAIGSDSATITSDLGMSRGSYPLADSRVKLAHGAGQLQARGAGSAQGGVFVGQGRSTSSDTVNIFDVNGQSFTIPNNTLYTLDIDISIISEASGGGSVLYAGGKVHSVIKTNSAGAVTINNAGGVYGYLSGITVSVQSAGNNLWNVRAVLSASRNYAEAVVHIKSTEIKSESGDLNGASVAGLLGVG